MDHGPRVALVTCAAFPDLWEDDRLLHDALGERGVTVDAVRWDDPEADWTGYDLTVIRSPWDYIDRPEAFVAWARSVPRLANPADVVAWNTDKTYLRDLAAAGIPIIETTYVLPGETWTAPADGEWVVKPAVSAGSRDTARYLLPGQSAEAVEHVERLTAAGRTAMVQPYLSAVDTDGETAVLCTPDASGEVTYSHGIRKSAMLTARGDITADITAERITPRTPSAAELELAARVLDVIPGGAERLLYARVDMIPAQGGMPCLIELELTEPSLFLLQAPGAAARLADAVIARI